MFKKITQVVLLGSMMATTGLAVEASAAGYMVNTQAKTYNFPGYDRLNLRKWPASHSARMFKIKRNRKVIVERCILKSGADWCLISQKGKPWKRGWANGRFFKKYGRNFASPRHDLAYDWH